MSAAGGQPDASHTVLSVLQGAESWLRGRGIDAPKRSAELLLGKVLGLGRLQLYLAHDRPLDPAERATLRELVARRGKGEPLAYVLGSWAFRSLELTVGPAVLVPRPETEDLVTLVLERAPHGARIVDLGTGSGAIALALAAERPDLRVLATDVSKNALAIARGNAERLGLADRVAFALGSWWEAVPPGEPWHVVVSNPPYVDADAGAELAADVRAHEPPLALFAAKGDVASCYRAIVAGLAERLVPGGWFCAETGVGASDAACELLATQPFLVDVELRKDLAGIDRYLLARRAAT